MPVIIKPFPIEALLCATWSFRYNANWKKNKDKNCIIRMFTWPQMAKTEQTIWKTILCIMPHNNKCHKSNVVLVPSLRLKVKSLLLQVACTLDTEPLDLSWLCPDILLPNVVDGPGAVCILMLILLSWDVPSPVLATLCPCNRAMANLPLPHGDSDSGHVLRWPLVNQSHNE